MIPLAVCWGSQGDANFPYVIPAALDALVSVDYLKTIFSSNEGKKKKKKKSGKEMNIGFLLLSVLLLPQTWVQRNVKVILCLLDV